MAISKTSTTKTPSKSTSLLINRRMSLSRFGKKLSGLQVTREMRDPDDINSGLRVEDLPRFSTPHRVFRLASCRFQHSRNTIAQIDVNMVNGIVSALSNVSANAAVSESV
jgi:hypothetical protein